MSAIVVLVSNDEVRDELVKVLSKTGAAAVGRPFVPDPVDFLSKENPALAIIDAAYFEKSDGDLKTRIPKTNLLAWLEKYDPARAVSLIGLGAMDVLSAPVNRTEITGVVGHFSGGFYYKRKSDYSLPAKIARNLKIPALVAVAAVAVAAAVFAAKQVFFGYSVPKPGVYTLTVENPTGICVERGKVWVSDWLSQTIYGFDLHKAGQAAQFQSYYFPDCNPLFVNKTDKMIWTGTGDGSVRKYSVEGDAPAMVEKFASSAFSPSGFCLAGDFVYTVDSQTKMIYQHVVGAGYPIVNSYEFAGATPVGIIYDGKYFYIADVKTSRIYRHLGPANQFVPVGSYSVSMPAGEEIAGFCKGPHNLYIVSSSKPAKLYVYPFKTVK